MGCALDGAALVDVIDDRLDLFIAVGKLAQSCRHRMVDDPQRAAADQPLVLDQRQVWLHTRRITVHHEADGPGRRQDRRLTVAVAVRLSQFHRLIPDPPCGASQVRWQ